MSRTPYDLAVFEWRLATRDYSPETAASILRDKAATRDSDARRYRRYSVDPAAAPRCLGDVSPDRWRAVARRAEEEADALRVIAQRERLAS